MIHTLNLELKRVVLTPLVTLGVLRIDGKHQCFTLEDPYRPAAEAKVPGRTAIPCGEYDVEITDSPKFKRRLPLIFNVEEGGRRFVRNEGKQFEGVRFHALNNADESEGCVGPGRHVIEHATRGYTITESGLAMGALFERIDKAEHDGLLVKLLVSVVT